MKKLISLLLVVMVLALSGCDANDGSLYCKLAENVDECTNGTTDVDLYVNEYYTQEEVDLMFEELRNELNEIFDFAEQDWTVQDFVDYIDDLEDIIDLQEKRITELENVTE